MNGDPFITSRIITPRNVGSIWAMAIMACLLGCEQKEEIPPATRHSRPATAHSDEEPLDLIDEPVDGDPDLEDRLPAFSVEEIVDLTHAFGKDTIFWPTDTAGFQFERGPFGVTERGYFYSANRFAMAEHGGTHLDAPIHFSKDGRTSDQIPLSQLLGDAALIDVSEACRDNPDYQVSIADFRDWEERNEQALVDVIVLIRTGYYAHWSDREKYLGTATTGEEALRSMHFPGLDPEAARWLVDHRKPKAVGIDTASIDYGQSYQFESHVRLCEHNVPILENVANLGGLPETDFAVIALPMKIAGGSGGPLRIVALLGD